MRICSRHSKRKICFKGNTVQSLPWYRNRLSCHTIGEVIFLCLIQIYRSCSATAVPPGNICCLSRLPYSYSSTSRMHIFIPSMLCAAMLMPLFAGKIIVFLPIRG